MAPVGSGRRKLAELVADHIFCDIYRNMLAAVVHRKRMTYEIREIVEDLDQVFKIFFSPVSFIC